jgi:hypothetical protein
MNDRKILLFAILILGLILIFNIPTLNITGKSTWPWITGNSLSCIDSDNGLNYYQFGTVFNNNKYYPDECYDYLILKETFCENDKLKFNIYECHNGCFNGICI